MRRLSGTSLLLFVSACGGGSDSGSSGIPPEALAMESKLESGMGSFVPRAAGFESSMVGILNPGTPLAQGVVLTPDGSAGAPPFSFLFNGPYDGNADGSNETTLSGGVSFDSDPDSAWTGLQGRTTTDVDILGLVHVYHGDMAFTIGSGERRLSGSGTFTEPLGNTTTTLSVDPSTPLRIAPATGAPDAVPNACGYSLDGDMRLTVSSPGGTLSSTWNFAATRASAAVSATTFTDGAGRTWALPDSSVDIRCGAAGSIADWAGTFEMDWACLPRESGRARLTIASTGAATVSISDEDPPGSGDVKVYAASVLGASPYAIRGYFIGGPAGSTYREDFNWTLAPNGKTFSQISAYVYQEGPSRGSGGLCIGSARRL